MLVARQGRRQRAGRARHTRATSASRCSSAPPRAPRRPRRRSGCYAGCSEERRVRDAGGETGPPAPSRTRATYSSDVSVALLLSASESTATPAAPIRLPRSLQREKGGQECSCRVRAAGNEQSARDLRERRHGAQYLRKLVTIPPPCELLNHNLSGVHLCRPERCYKRPPPEKSSPHRTRRCQRRSTRFFSSLVARLHQRASVLSALRPGHDAPYDRASRARDARRARRARQARSPRAPAPRARPARLSASARPPARPPARRSLHPPRACALLLLDARCPRCALPALRALAWLLPA